MKIHTIEKDGKISQHYETTKIVKEKEIEDFLENNIQILEEDLMVIGRQVETDEGNYADLMALDKDANVVIVELKRDLTPREVIAQIIDYGVWAEDLKYDDLHAIAKRNHLPDHHRLSDKFEEWTDEIDPEWNQTQKLYVVAQEIDPSTKKKAKFLRKNGIELFCVELHFKERDGHQIVIKEEIVGEITIPTRKSVIPSAEEDHRKKGNESAGKLYDFLKSEILKLGNDVKINPVKAYIGFVRKSMFAFIKIRQNYLRVTLVTKEGFIYTKQLTIQYHSKRKNLRRLNLSNKDQIEDLMNLIKQTYESN